jgi:Thiamine pyrophosphate enzyme, N-terminal TPP binding domain
VPQTRGVLAVFEGVATGAADGYARMTGRPAAVLLHLGPGLGTGWPTCTTPGAPAPRSSPSSARTRPTTSTMTRRCSRTSRAWPATSRAGIASRPPPGRWAAAAVAASVQAPGQVATLVLPADVSWSEGAVPARPRALPPAQPVDDETVGRAGLPERPGRAVHQDCGAGAGQADAAHAPQPRAAGHQVPARFTEQQHAAAKGPGPRLASRRPGAGPSAAGHKPRAGVWSLQHGPPGADGSGRHASTVYRLRATTWQRGSSDGQGSNSRTALFRPASASR